MTMAMTMTKDEGCGRISFGWIARPERGACGVLSL